MSFSLSTISPTGPVTLRITYTSAPLQVSATGATDGLNPHNYFLIGPNFGMVLAVSTVPGLPTALDLTLASPLQNGAWGIIVSNVVSQTSATLTSPTSLNFNAWILAPLEAIGPGAANDLSADIIRKHFNPAMQGRVWTGMITAMGSTDDIARQNTRLAYNQLFLSTSSGVYLTRNAGDNGIERPVNIGMSDDLFRDYAIKISNNKITETSFWEILETFYGLEAVTAVSDSIAEPYDLSNSKDITIIFDGQSTVLTIFQDGDFAVPWQAKASEVAAALTRSFRLNSNQAYALSVVDPSTGLNHVRIYSGALGLASSVQVVGGFAQTILQFPTKINCFSGLPTWTINQNTITGVTTLAPGSQCDLSQVQIGDYACIYGNEFNGGNIGTFTVINVFWAFPGGELSQYIQVNNLNGFNQTVTQGAAGSFLFFRPTKKTINNAVGQTVSVLSLGKEIDIVLPATSRAVNRHYNTGAYLSQPNVVNIASAVQTADNVLTVTTATPHGLSSSSSQVIIDGLYGSRTAPVTTTGSYTSGGVGTSDESQLSIWSETAGTTNPSGINGLALTLSDGRIFHGYGVTLASGVQSYDNNWGLLNLSAVTIDSTLRHQVTFQDQVSGSPTVPTACEWPAASIGVDLNWYDGSIVITGGLNGTLGSFSAINNVQIYNPALAPGVGSIVAGPHNLNLGRAQHVQTTAPATGSTVDDAFFVAGGFSGATVNWQRATNTCEYWEKVSPGAWITGPAMSYPRAKAAIANTSTNKILVAGGRAGAQGMSLLPDTVSHWSFDSALGTTTDNGTLAGYVVLTDGAGTTQGQGESGLAKTIVSGQGINTTTTWSILLTTFQAPFTLEGWFYDAGHTLSGTIVEMGSTTSGSTGNTQIGFGLNSAGGTMSVWYHNGSKVLHQFTTTATLTSLSSEAWTHYAITWDGTTYKLYINAKFVQGWAGTGPTDGTVTSFGFGLGYGTLPNNTGMAFDETRLSNSAHNPIDIIGAFQASTGEIFYQDLTRIGIVHASCELFDPFSSTWSMTGAMAWSRFNHKLIPLPDGQILVVGGIGYRAGQYLETPQYIMATEVYDPATGRWRFSGNLLVEHDYLTAEYVPGLNRVVVTGGTSNVTEYFDPTTYSWSIAPNNGIIREKSRGAVGFTPTGYHVLALMGGVNPSTNTSASYLELFLPGADNYVSGNMNSIRTITSIPDSTHLTFTGSGLSTYMTATGGSMTLFKALSSKLLGPHIFDPKNGVGITKNGSTITQNVSVGQHLSALNVVDATVFPDSPGWIVVGFGYNYQVTSIPYLGRLSNTALMIDYSFVFNQNIPTGATVILLKNKGVYSPESTIDLQAFWLTDSPAGRIAAQNAAQMIAAAGPTLSINVVYPGDRGLGGEFLPAFGQDKLSDKVAVWAGSDPDIEVENARNE